jgi:hypothetical protein
MTTHEGIDNWREADVLRTAQFETGLFIVRNEIEIGMFPVEAFVYAGNVALHDSVDTVFVFELGKAAFGEGLLDATRNRMYGPTEIVNSVYRLEQAGVIVPDETNQARYYHPKYLQDVIWS